MQQITQRPLKVAILCEYTGVVRDAFRALGHDAISFDLLDTERPGPHVKGDVLTLPREYWRQFDLAVCHPTCTYLTNAGAKHLYLGGKKDNGPDPERWKNMREGAAFFKWMLDLPVNFIAVENPIMHGHAKAIVGRKQSQVIQPWMFGHMESKATCLWLKGLPNLVATDNVKAEMLKLPRQEWEKCHRMPPGPNRGLERSRTLEGIANAFARQWGEFVQRALFTMEEASTPPHITREWDSDWNPVCVPECPACGEGQ